MLHLQVFTDGSVNTQSKVGYGAYLALSDSLSLHQSTITNSLKNKVKVKRFEKTSSTKLELQTMLWAVGETVELAKGKDFTLTVYTDSQNIVSLPERRDRLEQRNFLSSKKRLLNNASLYQEFFSLASNVGFKLIKVKGHLPDCQKREIDNLFSVVDQAARQALREGNNEQKLT